MVERVEVSTDHLVGGERLGSPDRFPDVSPIDEQVIADVARGDATTVGAAVDVAGQAAEEWGRTPPKDRAAVLHRIADGVETRIEELSAVETRDNGSLLRSHRSSVMPRVARNFRFFADKLLDLEGAGDATFNGNRERFTWDPSGVTAVVGPWNAPLMLATWRIAPALAAGNAVVHKPPEWAPLTASLLGDIALEAGLVPGAYNVVQGIGEEAGAALVGHPGVSRIAFTGSVETGRLVAAAAAANLTPTSLELGGKSPFLIFADADPDAALRQAIGQFDNAGQVCLAGTRLLIESSIYDDFLKRFVEATARVVQGDPRDDATDIGPLISRSTSIGRWVRPRRSRREPARSSAAARTMIWVGSITGRPVRGCACRLAAADPRDLRARDHGAALPRRSGGDQSRQRGRLRPRRNRVHRRRGAGPSGGRTARRGHRLGQLLLRSRSRRTVRWFAELGDRP